MPSDNQKVVAASVVVAEYGAAIIIGQRRFEFDEASIVTSAMEWPFAIVAAVEQGDLM